MKRLRCAEKLARKGNSDFIARSCSQCQELPSHVSGHCAGAEVDNTCSALAASNLCSLRHLFTPDNRTTLKNNPFDRPALQTKRDMPCVIRFIRLAKRRAPGFVNIFCVKSAFAQKIFCCSIQIIPLLINLKHPDKYLAELFGYAGDATADHRTKSFLFGFSHYPCE